MASALSPARVADLSSAISRITASPQAGLLAVTKLSSLSSSTHGTRVPHLSDRSSRSYNGTTLRPLGPVHAILEKPKPAPAEEMESLELRLQKEVYASTAADPSKPPFGLTETHSKADGQLDIVRWEGDRMLRIWKPAGWNPTDEPSGYPVLFLNDGQNLFEDSQCMSGCSWRAAETASELIASGRVPPFVIVGIDHPGALRSYDYTPYKPGTGPTGVRKDAASWPGGGVDSYIDRVVHEILPWASKQYHLSSNPSLMAFGGSSFGGIATLVMAMRHPQKFGSVLIESPSLWITNEKFLKEDLAKYEGPWPERSFLAMGSQEYTFTRKHDPQPEFDKLLTTYIPQVTKMLESNGVSGEDRVLTRVEDGAGHTESAWARRLPEALSFLHSPWWRHVAAGREGHLYFTSPKRPQASKPAVIFFNRAKSDTLRDTEGAPVLSVGFNEWSTDGTQEVGMQRCHWLGLPGGDWWVASFKVDATAYEMNFVFGDGTGTWDNNGGNNFYRRVRALNLSQLGNPEDAPQLTVDKLAEHNKHNLYFTYPSHLVAGGPVQFFCNRALSGVLQHSPNVNLHYGFNDWSEAVGSTHLKPTSLWKGEGIDWWATDSFEVPEGSFEMNFAFNDGGGNWESNGCENFRVKVKDLKRLEGDAKAAADKMRKIESVERSDLAWGVLHVITLAKKEGKNSKWTEEKRIRVWTPPGYDKDSPPPGGWPVLYLNDGQNMFEDWLAHQGVSWRCADTASELIRSKRVPPFVICAIDNAGPMRSLNFLPYVPGTGVGGFRGDCERWPGGGVSAYLHRIQDEIIPLVVDQFNVTTDPSRTAFGGGSFAGVTALYVATHFSHVFGSILCESPSLWVTEGRFLGDLAAHQGMLPERIFIGCGTKEYSATRDHEREDVDALLTHYYHEAARILHEKGMRGDRMRFLVEEGAGHHELAWQWRLTGALEYLLSPWWE